MEKIMSGPEPFKPLREGGKTIEIETQLRIAHALEYIADCAGKLVAIKFEVAKGQLKKSQK